MPDPRCRIRVSHLRDLADDAVQGGLDPNEATRQELARARFLNLDRPHVRLEGRRLPSGRIFRARSPGTNWPDDEIPAVIEGIVKSTTSEGDHVLCLFPRSATVNRVCALLDRLPVSVSPYDIGLHDVVGTDLLDPDWHHVACRAFGLDFWDSSADKERLEGVFNTALVHVPSPGVVHHLKLLHDAQHEPAPFPVRNWDDFQNIDDFATAIKAVLELWDFVIADDGHLFLHCGWIKDRGYCRPSWPFLWPDATNPRWKLEKRWAVETTDNKTAGNQNLPPKVRTESTLLHLTRKA